MAKKEKRSLFNKLFQPKTQYIKPSSSFETLTSYMPTFTPWSGNLYDNELVRSAIHSKAKHMSKLSVDIQGSAQPAMKTRLKNQPNDFMSWSQFIYRVSSIYDLYNNCIIVPIIDSFGTTVGVFPILPQNCKVVEVNGVPYLQYTFITGKQCAMELSKCGIMKKHFCKDDIFGEENMEPMASTMKLFDLNEQAISEGVKASATYRFMATLNNFSLDDDLVKERDAFINKNMVNNKTGGLLLFPNTYSNIQQIQSHPYTVDASVIEQMQKNVYNYFGISEKILQGTATEDELTSFYDCEIEPFSIQLSEVLSNMIYTRIERSNGNRIVVNSNRLQYMATSTKISLASTLADRGVLTVGEIRELFNYAPFENEELNNKVLARGEYYDVVLGKQPEIINETEGEDDGNS